MMLERAVLEKVLSKALENGGELAEIFLEEKTSNALVSEDRKLEKILSGKTIGAGIRLITDEKTYYAYTNDLQEEALLKCAETVSKALKGKSNIETISLGKIKPTISVPIAKYPEDIKIDDKAFKVKEAESACWDSDERISQVMVVYGDVTQHVEICNSDGEYVEDDRIRTKFIVQAVAKNEKGQIQTGYDAEGAIGGFEFIEGIDVAGLAQNASKRAIMMLNAKKAPAGTMPVVMAARAGGTMIHEACGHGLEADLVEKKISVYGGKLGEKVASPLVTVVDDGTMQGKYGSSAYDDEGTACRKNILIENGILKAYMTDKLSAQKMSIALTGNGRRESYMHKPVTRMTNTYIQSGEDDPAEIIRDTKKGFYAAKMGGGQVNTANGDFVFEVSEGYLIEDGEIKEPVRGATLTGNGPDALSMIDMVGNDLGYSIGTCGKDGQGVPVADAQPTIRIPKIIVGGVMEE